jgi:Arc/MetJ family transcription regulator
MTETLIDIDDELLAEAATILGTSTKKDTVNAALADVLRVRTASKLPKSARNGLESDLLDPEVANGAQRQ